MVRLTERLNDELDSIWVKDHDYTGAAKKLAEYEDLEEQCIKENTWGLRILLKIWKEFFEDIQELYEYRKLKKQGRLLELPCKTKDKVYYIVVGGRKDIIKSTKVIQIIIKDIDNIIIQCEKGVTLKPNQVFSTYEVAEQVLKERKNC